VVSPISSSSTSLTKEIAGSVYLDLPTLSATYTTATLIVYYETSNSSYNVNADLYDWNGATNSGTPTIISGSTINNNSTTGYLASVDISAQILDVSYSAGIFKLRIWSDSSTMPVTCSYSRIELS
jgi:hypothetical protein